MWILWIYYVCYMKSFGIFLAPRHDYHNYISRIWIQSANALDIYCKYVFSKRLVYNMNSSPERIITVQNGPLDINVWLINVLNNWMHKYFDNLY